MMNAKSPRTIRVAVVGAGPAGQAHAFGFRNAGMADTLAGVEIVLDTIVDPNTALAETVARRYGFARTAADVSEILDTPRSRSSRSRCPASCPSQSSAPCSGRASTSWARSRSGAPAPRPPNWSRSPIGLAASPPSASPTAAFPRSPSCGTP